MRTPKEPRYTPSATLKAKLSCFSSLAGAHDGSPIWRTGNNDLGQYSTQSNPRARSEVSNAGEKRMRTLARQHVRACSTCLLRVRLTMQTNAFKLRGGGRKQTCTLFSEPAERGRREHICIRTRSLGLSYVASESARTSVGFSVHGLQALGSSRAGGL